MLTFSSIGHKFLQYDYGSAEKNLKHYGSERPKEYDLKRVTAPVYLFLAENDPLADPKVSNHLIVIMIRLFR